MKYLALLFQLCILCCAAWGAQNPELPQVPDGLNEMEAQQIRKENNPKKHVETAVRIANARLAQALKRVSDEADAALTDIEIYGALITYSDDYTRQLNLQPKERNKILKVIEQSIFKQQRNLEGARQQLPLEAREQTEKLVATLKSIRLRALNDVLGNGEIIKH